MLCVLRAQSMSLQRWTDGLLAIVTFVSYGHISFSCSNGIFRTLVMQALIFIRINLVLSKVKLKHSWQIQCLLSLTMQLYPPRSVIWLSTHMSTLVNASFHHFIVICYHDWPSDAFKTLTNQIKHVGKNSISIPFTQQIFVL